MSPRFVHYLKVVTLAHALAVGAFLMVSGWRYFFRPKPPRLLPVTLVVEAHRPAPVTPLPAPAPQPLPTPAPIPTPEPTPVAKPQREPIVRSTKRVTRTLDAPAPEKQLSEEEIRKVLERGVQLGDHTNAPHRDQVSLGRIRRAFYDAWSQPSKQEAGQDVVRAEVSFGADGRITGRRVSAPSGNPAMDASVMRALRGVTRIDGLTPAFLQRHPSVNIAFKVE